MIRHGGTIGSTGRQRYSENDQSGSDLLNQLIQVNSALENGEVLNYQCHCVCWGLGHIGTYSFGESLIFCPCFESREISQRYIKEISRELNIRDPYFLLYHPELHPTHRSVLLDWVAEVCKTYSLQRTTYYLSIYLVDSYLQLTTDKPRRSLQTLGAASIFSASKIIEVNSVTIDQILLSTSYSCSADELIKMEMEVLKTIEWEYSALGPIGWLYIYLHTINYRLTSEEFTLVTNLLDICNMDVDSHQFTSPALASAALHLVVKESPIPNSSRLDDSCSVWMYPYYIQLMKFPEAREIPENKSELVCPIMKKFSLEQHYFNNLRIYNEISTRLSRHL
ncbi:G1/S-specific cyclin-E2-like [Cimex lectularius]|uniref:Cyclin-like domain-containing protein n=1 Tax=Cimex lectularius TaxID=79782 RepID=A0A8I6TH32_CIMLE|nr:G1/S-specific cyclin-E2-like [Cimex lectularius]